MFDDLLLKSRVHKLLELATERNTKQGVIIFESVLNKLDKPMNELEKKELLESFKKALTGMEAHGHFTKDEFEIVTSIRGY